MIENEVLFQGTWGEALEHAGDIPRDRKVRILPVVEREAPIDPERRRAAIDQVIARARELEDAPTGPEESDDPYMQLLAEKYRKQGLTLTSKTVSADDPL